MSGNFVRNEPVQDLISTRQGRGDFLKKGEISRNWQDIRRPYQCLACQKSFVEMFSLQIHALSCNLKKRYLHKTREYASSSNLPPPLLHDPSFGQLVGRRACDVGTSTFTSKQYLNAQKTTNPFAERFSCDVEDCGFSFRHRESLRSHKRSRHLKVTYACDVKNCQSKFTCKKSLKAHNMSKHLGVTYACDMENCQSIYTCKQSLREHKLSKHFGVTYACDMKNCQYSSKNRQSLKAHKLSYHFGDCLQV